MRRTAIAIPALLAATLGLAGCASASNDTHHQPSPPTASSTSTASAPATPVGTGPADNDTVAPAPTAEPTSQAAAAAVAVKVMTAYARPDLSADAWLKGLDPYLSQTGVAAYQGTDPAKVPVSHVTGPGTVMAAATAYALNVSVPTNNGIYVVALTRPNTGSPWLADRIIVPGN